MGYYIITQAFCLLLSTSFASSIRTGYYWHITDLHYDHTYWTSKLSCNAEVQHQGKYGDYWCDSPWTLVQDSIVSMANIYPGVDFILWTGDSVAHIADEYMTLNVNLEILTNITDTVKTSFPRVPVFASLGNHDFYPDNQAEYAESDIYDQVSVIWERWISNQSQIEQFKQGGYYMARIAPKLRLLALNTNLYYTKNKLTANVADPAGQMDWMSEQLIDARNKGEKVIVTGHIPPSMQTPGLADWFYPRHKSRFVNILLANSAVIAATIFGHDHSDGFKIIQESTGNRAVTQFTAPSVTPWRFRVSTKSGEPHNPGIRLVEYDQDTGQHKDYQQYYINLTDSNRLGYTAWTRLYSFTEDYNVSDMSVASLRQIFSLMDVDKGTSYSNKYCTYSVVSNYPINCTDYMRAEIFCGGLYYDREEAVKCAQAYLYTLNGVSIHNLNLFIVIAVVFVQMGDFMIQ